jgi:hypothetical protein
MARRKNTKRIDPRYFLNETVNRGKDLDEGALNIALDIAGLIPGVGEFADAANAALYAKEGKWLFAALSLISVIPELGDAIGKGGKISMWVAKNFPKGAKAIAKYGPDILKVVELLQKHAGTVANLFDMVVQDERVKGFLGGDEGVAEMKAALDEFAAGGTNEWPPSAAQAAEE